MLEGAWIWSNWTCLPFWHDEPARLSLMHTPSMDAKRKRLLRFKRKINKSEQHVEDQTCCLEQNWSDSLPGISVLFLQYVASTFSTVSHKNWFYTWNDVLHKMLISWPIHADFKWTPIKCLRERVSGAQCCSGSCFSIVHLTKKITFKKWKTKKIKLQSSSNYPSTENTPSGKNAWDPSTLNQLPL